MPKLIIEKRKGEKIELELPAPDMPWHFQLDDFNLSIILSVNEAQRSVDLSTSAEGFDPAKAYEVGDVYCIDSELFLVTASGTTQLSSSNLLEPVIY